jgi:hypothetical protein
MAEKQENKVLGKLDKVADSLERSTHQLSGVVTQQQLDVLRERVSNLETTAQFIRQGTEAAIQRSAAHATEAEVGLDAVLEELASLERDFAGQRALIITAFVLSTVSLIGLVLINLW